MGFRFVPCMKTLVQVKVKGQWCKDAAIFANISQYMKKDFMHAHWLSFQAKLVSETSPKLRLYLIVSNNFWPWSYSGQSRIPTLCHISLENERIWLYNKNMLSDINYRDFNCYFFYLGHRSTPNTLYITWKQKKSYLHV